MAIKAAVAICTCYLAKSGILQQLL